MLAVPSKGRLQENAAAFFARAGLDIVQGGGARDYRGTLTGMDTVEIAFLSAADIVAQLAAGHVHLGVTGEDLVRETIADAEAKGRTSGAARLRPRAMWWLPCPARGST